MLGKDLQSITAWKQGQKVVEEDQKVQSIPTCMILGKQQMWIQYFIDKCNLSYILAGLEHQYCSNATIGLWGVAQGASDLGIMLSLQCYPPFLKFFLDQTYINTRPHSISIFDIPASMLIGSQLQPFTCTSIHNSLILPASSLWWLGWRWTGSCGSPH